jgi:hypothetical protein
VGFVVLDAPQPGQDAPPSQPGFEIPLVTAVIDDGLPRPSAEIIEMAEARTGIPGKGARQPGCAPSQTSQNQPCFVVAIQKRVRDRVDLVGTEILKRERGLEAPVGEAGLLLLPG